MTVTTRLHEALQLLPDLPSADSAPDLYTPELLRQEPAEFAALIGVLAASADMLRWGALAAHHATLTSAALRAAGWPLTDRRAINPVRTHLYEALEPTYRAALSLSGAAARARSLAQHLHLRDA